MERTLRPEEKIKRAEEIYARRRSGYTRQNVATVNVSEEKNYSLFRKMVLQIAICLVIYFIFYLIQNSNYVFSEDVINKAKEILSYDIDISGMCKKIEEVFSSFNEGISTNIINNDINNNIEDSSINENNVIEEQNVIQEDAVGGAEIENIIINNEEIANDESTENSNTETENIQPEDVPQTNAEYVKRNFSLIKPIEGIVTSEFGDRESTNPIVSKHHSGIDIAANTGTVICSAMDGTVVVSSTVGEYGQHIKITNGDVSTLYAHCSKLYVKEGEYITKGQEIAEVGETGNATGPHLHFEIIRGNTYINPREILDF